VRHEIVHNARVVRDLEAQGAIFVEELHEVPDGAVTIFSAHGVPASVEAEAEKRGLPVYDATCPLVSKVHNHGIRFAREGRNIVLIGHAGHAEVEGTLGQIPAPVHLVATAEDVAALPLADDAPVAYLTQTTLSVDETRAVIAALQARFADCVGPMWPTSAMPPRTARPPCAIWPNVWTPSSWSARPTVRTRRGWRKSRDPAAFRPGW
jgi:4-hydroxy-3-methylbut-2-enyl diphosphate reductase